MPADNYGYYQPPTVSAARANAGAGTFGSFTSPGSESNTGAIVVLSVAGASLLGFGVWLMTRDDDAPRRRGSRR